MATQTVDLLNDPFLLYTTKEMPEENSLGNGCALNGGGEIRLGLQSGLGQVGTIASVGLAGSSRVPSLPYDHPNFCNNNIQPSSNAAVAAAAASGVGVGGLPPSVVKDKQEDVSVEVNLSRFCINPSLFRRVSSLNWVLVKRSGHSNVVLKLDARCHPDVFEMVLKFFLYSTLPEYSELSNRKATELVSLARPLDGAEALVQHSERYLEANRKEVVGPSSAASFLKRQLSSVSSLRPSRSSEEKKNDGSDTINPMLTGSEQSVAFSQTQPLLLQQMLSQAHQPKQEETFAQARTQAALQETHRQNHSQKMVVSIRQSQRPNGSIRSTDSIPSHVDMKCSLSEKDRILLPKSSSERVSSIARADSNNSTIEDESISKLSHPSSRANSEDQNDENRQTGNDLIDFDTAVPPSPPTYLNDILNSTAPKFSGKGKSRIDYRPLIMRTPGMAGKKFDKKDKKKLNFPTRMFRTVVAATSNRGAPKMSHEEYCRTSDHIM